MLRAGIEMEKIKNLNSGLGQFCLHLGNYLAEEADENTELHYFLPKDFKGSFDRKIISHPLSKTQRITRVKTSGLDIFHCTHQQSDYFPRDKKTKTVITIHDLNFLEKYKDGLKKKLMLRALQKRVDRAHGIIFISSFTEGIAKKHLELKSLPTRIIYNGNSLTEECVSEKPQWAPNENFLFTIGIISAKKNFHVLIPMLKKTGMKLVIAGQKHPAYAAKIEAEIKKYGVEKEVIMPGIVNEKEKVWLYKNCSAFVFPSLTEGFGLPVIEAMAFGKPVFISTRTSLPEIGGKEAFYFENFGPGEMAEVILKGLKMYEDDPQKKLRLMQWAEKFSWNNTARQYLEFFREVAGK